MVEQTDEEFIAEIAALAEKATGLPVLPWEARNGDVYFDGERVAKDCWTADAAFIAESRTAIPRLIGIIERLEKEGDELYADLNHFHLAIIARLEKAGRERDAALAKVERLTEALKPFANLEYVAINVGTENIGLDLEVSHFQAARAALKAKE